MRLSLFPVDLQIFDAGLVNFVFTKWLRPTCAGQKYAIFALNSLNLHRAPVPLLPRNGWLSLHHLFSRAFTYGHAAALSALGRNLWDIKFPLAINALRVIIWNSFMIYPRERKGSLKSILSYDVAWVLLRKSVARSKMCSEMCGEIIHLRWHLKWKPHNMMATP